MLSYDSYLLSLFFFFGRVYATYIHFYRYILHQREIVEFILYRTPYRSSCEKLPAEGSRHRGGSVIFPDRGNVNCVLYVHIRTSCISLQQGVPAWLH